MPLLALMLCVGAFLFPATAYAAESAVDPPAITASINDDTLHIEAVAGYYGVEAVFIGEKRFNYRVDSAIDVDARDFFGDTSEMVSVYAIDFAGNKSNVVELENPYYAPPEPPKQAQPFTPDGQAEVVDQATDEDGKIFYTFTTPDGNVFYLVIDGERDGDNVYFLNAVTERDLLDIAEKDGGSAIPTPAPEPPPEPPTETDPEPELEQEGGGGTIIFIVLAALAVGGAAYYFKIMKPKQQAQNVDDTDDDSEEYDDEDMEFEDEPDEDSDDADESGDDTGTEERQDEDGDA
jgi:hypothetical protein